MITAQCALLRHHEGSEVAMNTVAPEAEAQTVTMAAGGVDRDHHPTEEMNDIEAVALLDETLTRKQVCRSREGL